MQEIKKLCYTSPLGVIDIIGTRRAVLSVGFSDQKKYKNETVSQNTHVWDVLSECYMQLDEYFRGTRKRFVVDYRLSGTTFQKKVWQAMVNIPYGETVSYKDIAKAIGRENAARAVGNACRQNPVAIIVPCHRVIGSGGQLTGYGGGLKRKEWLIAHEKKRRYEPGLF